MTNSFKLAITIMIAGFAVTASADSLHYLANSKENSYFVLEATKNSPAIHTKEYLTGRHVTYYIGYRKQVNVDWMMGVGANHKSFTKISNQTELSFLTLQHEAYYILRMHHPVYLMVGPRIIYLVPTQRSAFPVARDPEFETEIGAGLSLLLQARVDKLHHFTARIDRWRGTKTDLFHGFEVAIGFNREI